jgi:hypothetical protein
MRRTQMFSNPVAAAGQSAPATTSAVQAPGSPAVNRRKDPSRAAAAAGAAGRSPAPKGRSLLGRPGSSKAMEAAAAAAAAGNVASIVPTVQEEAVDGQESRQLASRPSLSKRMSRQLSKLFGGGSDQ